MEVKKEAIVSCEMVGRAIKTEAKGPAEEVLCLTVRLLVDVALGFSKVGFEGIRDPKGFVDAICATATDMLDDMGGNQDGK